ncbi:MAG: hypothetical protein ACYCUM_11510, partial [Solirubrobacteraceae bacterium]
HTTTRRVPTTLEMPTTFIAQNGITIHRNTRITVTGCKPTRRHRHHHKRHAKHKRHGHSHHGNSRHAHTRHGHHHHPHTRHARHARRHGRRRGRG